VRLYTLVQALFGRKQMNEVLTEIFGQQFMLNLNQVLNHLKSHISQMRLNLKDFE
jgi:hypothetical protein